MPDRCVDYHYHVRRIYPSDGSHPAPLHFTPRAAFLYWAYSQPTEFDSLVAAQRQFMHDLYEGNLLADVAQVRLWMDVFVGYKFGMGSVSHGFCYVCVYDT